MNRRQLALMSVAAVAAVAALWFALHPADEAPAAAATSGTDAPALRRFQAKPLHPPPGSTVALSAEDEAFVHGLRDKFAPHIGDKSAQIKLIEQLLAYLEAHGQPGDLERAYSLLKSLFPDLADALFGKLQGLLVYDDWLRENREALMGLSPADRRAALWDARRQAFGEDAAEIWAGEVRGEKLRSSLEALESAQQLTTDEKLDRFLAAVHETYGERAPVFIERAQTELADNFLGLDSVQNDLRSMSASERQASLRHIRGGMGMDDAALQRWDDLDRHRDQAWSAGQQYLLERDALAAQYRGAEEAQRLRELQDRMFGAEAEVIRSEEAGGFFRYQHQRRIGRE